MTGLGLSELRIYLFFVFYFLLLDNTYAVELNKSSTGLGFSVLGGSDAHPDPVHCLVRVKKIFPYGPAHDSGLEVGDVILQVDNVKLRGLTNKVTTVVLFRQMPTKHKQNTLSV